MRIFVVIKIFFFNLRIEVFSIRVTDKKNCVKSNYCMRNYVYTLKLKIFQNIAKKFAKKICEFAKKFYIVFLDLRSSTTG